jgi:hypothetical protein
MIITNVLPIKGGFAILDRNDIPFFYQVNTDKTIEMCGKVLIQYFGTVYEANQYWAGPDRFEVSIVDTPKGKLRLFKDGPYLDPCYKKDNRITFWLSGLVSGKVISAWTEKEIPNPNKLNDFGWNLDRAIESYCS